MSENTTIAIGSAAKVREALVDLAVDAWNAVQPQGVDGLPLFENATKGETK